MRALLSVATRDGITVFARGLQSLDVELYATDGTREHLAQDGVEVRPVAELTGVQSMLDGQVKTFHHAIYAGILARRDQPSQLEELKREGIEPIDLVVVNVRPFGAEIGRALVGIDKAIEMIDVGGAALLGAAARNPAGGRGGVEPGALHPAVLGELKEHGHVSPELRAQLAAEAFGDGRRVPRGDRGLPQPAGGHDVPEAARDGPRQGPRPALRREPAPDRRALSRDDAPVDGRRRRDDPSRAARRRSTTCSTSTSRTAIAVDYTTPTVVITKHTDPVGLASARRARRGVPARARDGSGRLVRRDRRRQPDRSTGRRRARSPRTRTRR